MREMVESDSVKKSVDKAIGIVQQIKRDLVRDEPSKEVRIITEKPSQEIQK